MLNKQEKVMSQNKKKYLSGFTLVELSIVMAIIGILIGGVLKGREMIMNARTTSTVAQIRAVEAALTTFYDTYESLPGDMARASLRIPGCTAACDPELATASNGLLGGADSTVLSSSITATNPLPGGEENEMTLFWAHLLLTDLLGGITDSAVTDGTIAEWGTTHLAAKVGGGFFAGHLGGYPLTVAAGGGGGGPPGLGAGGPGGGNPSGNGCPGGGAGPGQGAGCGLGGGGAGGGGGSSIVPGRPATALGLLPNGIVLALRTDVGGAVTAQPGVQPLSPRHASQFDIKMDDGDPASGAVQAYGVSDSCYSDPDGTAIDFNYAGNVSSPDCGLLIQILP